MDSLNTIPSSGRFADVADAANTNFLLIQTAINLLQRAVIRDKGYFDSIEKLQSMYPSPNVGDWSIVNGTVYECSERGTWTKTDVVWSNGTINLAEYLKYHVTESADQTKDHAYLLDSNSKIILPLNISDENIMDYDCSKKGQSTFASLSDAINTVPVDPYIRHGGINLHFVLTETGEYVCYHNNSDTWSTDVNDYSQIMGADQIEATTHKDALRDDFAEIDFFKEEDVKIISDEIAKYNKAMELINSWIATARGEKNLGRVKLKAGNLCIEYHEYISDYQFDYHIHVVKGPIVLKADSNNQNDIFALDRENYRIYYCKTSSVQESKNFKQYGGDKSEIDKEITDRMEADNTLKTDLLSLIFGNAINGVLKDVTFDDYNTFSSFLDGIKFSQTGENNTGLCRCQIGTFQRFFVVNQNVGTENGMQFIIGSVEYNNGTQRLVTSENFNILYRYKSSKDDPWTDWKSYRQEGITNSLGFAEDKTVSQKTITIELGSKASLSQVSNAVAGETARAKAIEKNIMDNMPAQATENGFFVADKENNIGCKYDENGFDTALLSEHFKTLIKAIEGVGPTIVNDLVSGGKNRVLSAEQGKILKQMLDSYAGLRIGTERGTAYDGAKGLEQYVSILKLQKTLENFRQVAEEGVYFIDDQGYINTQINSEGLSYVGQIKYEIINE